LTRRSHSTISTRNADRRNGIPRRSRSRRRRRRRSMKTTKTMEYVSCTETREAKRETINRRIGRGTTGK
jgi:hypothetical protein